MNCNAQSRHTQVQKSGGGKIIPRTNSSAKGSSSDSITETETRAQQELLDLERRKLDLERERACLQSSLDRQRAEAERDLLRTTLEQERSQGRSILEQLKNQGVLLSKLIHRRAPEPSSAGAGKIADTGCVAEMLGYHAIKRVSADIIRGISPVVGLGTDVRILIVDRLDYAAGDIPFIEVTSQLSVVEVRCRKQVAINKELTDLVIQKEDLENDEKSPAMKTGATRLAPLAAMPSFLQAVTTEPALPPVTGTTGTAADISGYFRQDDTPTEAENLRKTASLIAAVAGSLRSEKRFVYVYNFYSMDTTGPQSKLMNMFAGVLDCSSRLAQSRNRLLYVVHKKAGLLAELKSALQKEGEEKPTPERGERIAAIRDEIQKETAWLDRANMEVLASDAIHAELGTFINAITMTGEGQQASKLAQAVFREKVHELGITHLLYCGVISSGGESVTRKWFFGTGTTSYLGGAVISYVLSRVEGDVLVSEVLPVLYSFGFDPAGQRNSPLKQVRFEKQEPKK